MKYLLIVPDGMADQPVAALGGLTPMAAARTPNLDALARAGVVGRVSTIPPGMAPGSDVAALSIMGYDPAVYYTGRAPLEAANQGIDLGPRDVAYRCNLITTDGERMLDYSAGEISSEEAAVLIRLIDEKLGTPGMRFYPGVSYRHLLIWRDGTAEVATTPPHDIMGQPIKGHLPRGEQEELLRRLMWDSHELLAGREINGHRADAGQPPGQHDLAVGAGLRAAPARFPINARGYRHGDLGGGSYPRHCPAGRAARPDRAGGHRAAGY